MIHEIFLPGIIFIRNGHYIKFEFSENEMLNNVKRRRIKPMLYFFLPQSVKINRKENRVIALKPYEN